MNKSITKNGVSVTEILILAAYVSQFGMFMLIPNASITRGLANIPWVTLFFVILSIFTARRVFTPLKINGKLILTFISINVISFFFLVFWRGVIDSTTFSALGYALLALIYFPISSSKSLSRRLEYWILVLAMIGMTSVLLQVAFFNFRSSLLIPSITLDKLEVRNGLRITYYDWDVIVALIVTLKRLVSRVRAMDFFIIIEVAVYLFYVSQTRMLEMVFVIMIGSLVCAHIYKQLSHGYISVVSSVVVIPIFGIAIFILKTLITALLVPILNGTYLSQGSYFARLGEVDYYIGIIRDSPIFGIGNTNGISTGILWPYIHGPQLMFYTQDVGLLGDVARLGIPILILFLAILIVNLRKDKREISNLPIIILIGSSIATFSIFTNGYALGFCLALITSRREDLNFWRNQDALHNNSDAQLESYNF